MAEAPKIAICDAKDGCEEVALHSYTWSWGETGICCEKHKILYQQAAAQMDRQVQFSPLANAEPPLQRSERAQLKGEVYAAEAEIEELKGRGAALYNQNVDLTRQVQTLTVHKRELEAQAKDARAEANKAVDELEELQAKYEDQNAELQRLRMLVPTEPLQPPTSRSALGLGGSPSGGNWPPPAGNVIE